MVAPNGSGGGPDRRSAIRRAASRARVLQVVYWRFRQLRRVAREQRDLAVLRCSRRRIPPTTARNGVIVSVASSPARIEHAWIAIETIFRQDVLPDRVVLVLADAEFATRELPRRLRAQQRRGLEVLWITDNARSFNKLVATRRAYPEATIITVDDDAWYEPWVVSRLVEEANRHPGTVVGHRGWTITRNGSGLAPYVDWDKASLTTPPADIFLTGCGGVLYPPDLLPVDLLTDTELALRLCPTADDVWFWAVATVAGVPARCLGVEGHRDVREQLRTPQLHDINREGGQNDVQLARVIEHFGLRLDAQPHSA
jgi:hypothetical protein